MCVFVVLIKVMKDDVIINSSFPASHFGRNQTVFLKCGFQELKAPQVFCRTHSHSISHAHTH